VGATPASAHAKLIVNALFTAQVAALAELLSFAEGARLDMTTLMQALDSLPVLSASAKGAALGMLAGKFEPMFPVELAAKDLRYALAAADSVATSLPMTRGTSEIFERARAQGLREEHLTALFKLYRRG
jgi:3-hydroxyisobutyrate dehydrogenase